MIRDLHELIAHLKLLDENYGNLEVAIFNADYNVYDSITEIKIEQRPESRWQDKSLTNQFIGIS